MPVELGAPLALTLLWLLLVLVALHRRRRSRRELEVPSLHLLPETTVVGGPAGGRPVDRLLLAVRMLVLTAAVLALAGPRVRGSGVEQMVLVIDASASMAAPDPGDESRSRMVAAQEAGRRALAEVSPRVALVLAAGVEPRAVGGWGTVSEAEDRLASVVAGSGPADLARAMAEARALARGGPVRLLGDGGAPIPGNRAITGLSFRPHLHSVEQGTFLIRVRRAATGGEDEEDVFVHVDCGGRRVGTVRVGVAPGGEGSVVLEYRGPGGAPAKATLVGDDPLPADNEAVIEVPRLGRRRIALVTPGNEELERALRAWPRARVEVRPPGRHPTADLLVLDGEAKVAPDRAAVLVRPPGEQVGHPAVPVPVPAPDRPGLAAVAALDLESFVRLPPVPDGGRVLVSASGDQGEPLLWMRSGPGPARAALAFDPGKEGLAGSPLHAVFWADLLSDLMLPEDGGCRDVPVGHVTASGPLARPGLYRLEDGCFIAWLPATESFPAPEPSGEVPLDDPGSGPARDAGAPLAGIAALLMLLEGLLAARSWRPGVAS